MTKPYSLDLGESYRTGRGRETACEPCTIFTVSVASVVRWSQRLRRTGSAAGGKMGGHRACTLIENGAGHGADRGRAQVTCGGS